MAEKVSYWFRSVGCFVTISVLISACATCCGNGRSASEGVVRERKLAATGDGEVDGDRALGYISDIIAFGPRHPGTDGAEKTRRYIVEKLRSFGLEPIRRDFDAYTPHPQFKKVKMANITVDIQGPGRSKILVGGHFDGKILEGVDFVGANDGGSSTALLLELARVWKKTPPPCPVRIAFFDGEEALVNWSETDSLYGSKRLAAEMRASGEHRFFRAVIIVDMIGDRNLQLIRETLSTPWLVQMLRDQGESLGFSQLFQGDRAMIEDDHLPFLNIGIPAAVMIDLKYGPGWRSNSYWHTDRDTLDKISPKSIETIAQVVLGAVSEIAAMKTVPGAQ